MGVERGEGEVGVETIEAEGKKERLRHTTPTKKQHTHCLKMN